VAPRSVDGPAPDLARLPDGMSPYFSALVLDDTPDLLRASYALRHQVYCVERQFLRAEDHPDGLERDAYDGDSVHVGVVNLQHELVATARLVQHTDRGLPALDHCTLYPSEHVLGDPACRVVEVSRLSVSRRYNRRAGDGFYSLQGATPRSDGPERRGGGEIVMTLYKALYQASKRNRFTHWLAATERSLQRLVARYGFPFTAVGPETDYYGAVSPYLMDLSAFDAVIASGRVPLLQGFLEGLEPEFRPRCTTAAA
jgi:N-acyl amino acid synthase of PEP-CTERM/exosortase system